MVVIARWPGDEECWPALVLDAKAGKAELKFPGMEHGTTVKTTDIVIDSKLSNPEKAASLEELINTYVSGTDGGEDEEQAPARGSRSKKEQRCRMCPNWAVFDTTPQEGAKSAAVCDKECEQWYFESLGLTGAGTDAADDGPAGLGLARMSVESVRESADGPLDMGAAQDDDSVLLQSPERPRRPSEESSRRSVGPPPPPRRILMESVDAGPSKNTRGSGKRGRGSASSSASAPTASSMAKITTKKQRKPRKPPFSAG